MPLILQCAQQKMPARVIALPDVPQIVHHRICDGARLYLRLPLFSFLLETNHACISGIASDLIEPSLLLSLRSYPQARISGAPGASPKDGWWGVSHGRE